MRYRLYELNDQQFEDLVCAICTEILGTGTVAFSPGKDGGRDGKFQGKANNFPSKSDPWNGSFIIQAKHTTNPVASYSDSSFQTILNKEVPKVENLVKSKELEFYLIFANRKLPGGKHQKVIDQFKHVNGVKDVQIFGNETIKQFLELNPIIWTRLGFDKYDNPLRIHAKDIADVITAFYTECKSSPSDKSGAKDFSYPGINTKNKINQLSDEYYNYIQENSMPYFSDITEFLKNPRNENYVEQYYSTADEIKAKLISKRDNFESFDDVFNHLYDLIIGDNIGLMSRRLANVFLHYMYCDCDIGKKHA